MIDKLVERWAAERPEEPAILTGGERLTWKALRASAEDIAQQLQSTPATGPVMFLIPPHPSSLAVMVGCAKAGRRVILVSHLLEPLAREYMQAVGAGCLLRMQGERVQTVLKAEAAPGAEPSEADCDLLIFTSGSTGKPKCAQHTWETLSRGAKVIPGLLGRRWLVAHSIAQFGGLQILMYCLLNGCTVVLPQDYDPRSGLDAILGHEVEYVDSTPTYLRRVLMAANPGDWARSRVRHVSLAGEIVDQKLLDGIKAALPGAKITHVYSSTELGSSIRVTDGREGFDAALIDGQRLKIVDGELYVRRSGRAMLGYLGQSELRDEWVGTNDLVEQVGDRVRFLGRKDDVINVGGAKVIPGVVENAIRAVPGVLGVQVGAHASSIVGNLVKATLWLEPNADRQKVLEAVRRHCTASLAAHMVPRVFDVADKIAVTPTQKWSRRGGA